MTKKLRKQKINPNNLPKKKEKRICKVSRSPKEEGQKKCVITGKFFPKEQMIRFMVDADNALVPDIAGKLSGHGIWVYADRGALEKAIKEKRPFRKSVHHDMTFFPSLAETVDIQLVKRCCSLLGLANKAGNVTIGYTKTKEALATHKEGLLLIAPDASKGQLEKLGLEKEGFNVKITDKLSAQDLGTALGLLDVSFVFVVKNNGTEKLFKELARLALYRHRLDEAKAEGGDDDKNSDGADVEEDTKASLENFQGKDLK